MTLAEMLKRLRLAWRVLRGDACIVTKERPRYPYFTTSRR
jgi:hypothetical protein